MIVRLLFSSLIFCFALVSIGYFLIKTEKTIKKETKSIGAKPFSEEPLFYDFIGKLPQQDGKEEKRL
jgi:hypothetical protein